METTIKDKKPINKKTAHKFSSPWHFSDVVLVVEDTKFHVHKSTLSMWSPVFEKMFTSGFSEKNAKEIPLPGKRAVEVEQLLKVIYSADAKQEITETNYEFLLELAREYQMDEVQQYCAQYMMQGINGKNCLHRYKIADCFGLEDVMEKCNKEARFKSSTDLEKSDDFRDLGFESKLKLCMARVKEFEKILVEYVGICSALVSSYYKKLSENVPRDIGNCDNKSSHIFYPYVGQDFDSSCRFCRKRIASYKGKYGVVQVNAVKYDDLFMKLYDLEHNNKVAKIIENMQAEREQETLLKPG